MKSGIQRIGVIAFSLGICVMGVAGTATAQTITKVMTGLDAPRGLAMGPEGGLYVTEAGTGVNTGPCTPVAAGLNCYSETGKITRLYRGVQERVVTGLPSIPSFGPQPIITALALLEWFFRAISTTVRRGFSRSSSTEG